MKYILLLILLIPIQDFCQSKWVQTCSSNANGRLDEFRYAPEPKKDTNALVRDTIYLDSLNWPNKEGRITRETVYVDPRSLYKSPGQLVTFANSGQIIFFAEDSASFPTTHHTKIIHRKGKKRKHYSKPSKTRLKTIKDNDEDEYYDLYFTGHGRVVDRWGSYVTIAESQGKFYHKKSK